MAAARAVHTHKKKKKREGGGARRTRRERLLGMWEVGNMEVEVRRCSSSSCATCLGVLRSGFWLLSHF
jgi:ferredoxin